MKKIILLSVIGVFSLRLLSIIEKELSGKSLVLN